MLNLPSIAYRHRSAAGCSDTAALVYVRAATSSLFRYRYSQYLHAKASSHCLFRGTPGLPVAALTQPNVGEKLSRRCWFPTAPPRSDAASLRSSLPPPLSPAFVPPPYRHRRWLQPRWFVRLKPHARLRGHGVTTSLLPCAGGGGRLAQGSAG